MKSQYAIFTQAGQFSRFEDLDLKTVPTIPLAKDGQPMAVPAGDAPNITSSQALTYSREGWKVIDRDAAIVASEALTKTEREEARSAIEEMVTIAQTPITTVAQASVAVRKIARAARWLLRNELN